MAEVVIATGSNLGDRLQAHRQAAALFARLSDTPVRKASIWESEPVGPARFPFLNSVAVITTNLATDTLLKELKRFERDLGRGADPVRWGPRILDLDIIASDSLVIETENLIIPHPEYKNRLFVLLPLKELFPGWHDPADGMEITTIIERAPEIMIRKTEYPW